MAGSEAQCAQAITGGQGSVAEPPKLLGPHAHVFVAKTSDDYACAPNNLTVGTMLRRRRSCGKKKLRLKLLVRDAEGTIHEASVLQHIRR
jgi:hypothetical protein